MVDYLIVGQGLAGSVLALELIERGYSVKVIDNNHYKSSSLIAGGLVHPMSFRRNILSWNAETLSKHSINYYQKKEKELNANFFESLTFLRLFGSIEEQNTWFTKKSISPYNTVLETYDDKKIAEFSIKNTFGIGKVNWSYRLNLAIFLPVIKNKLEELDALMLEVFDYSKLNVLEGGEINYKATKAKNIVFCEGHQYIYNPYFDYLPQNLTKGEILILKTQNLPPYLISKNCFLLPLEKDKYILGATYNWSSTDCETTEEAKEELLEKYNKISDEPVQILEHKAGIRPTTIDRKPILGTHPKYNSIHFFNGMGSKGVQLAPYYAEVMSNHLENKIELEREVSLERFTKKYFKK